MSVLPGTYLNPNSNSVQGANNKSYQFKINLVGDSSVGKTSLLSRFVNDKFEQKYRCTLGVEYKCKNISIDDNSIKLQVFDTCGAEKFRCITRSYYRSANGIFLVFDLTNPISFAKLEDWLLDILNSAPKGVEIFLIGNKKDLESRRNVSKRVIENILSKHSIRNYIETSALTGEGVIEAFHKMSEVLMDKEKLNKITYGDIKPQTKIEDNDRGSSLYSSTATKREAQQKQGCC